MTVTKSNAEGPQQLMILQQIIAKRSCSVLTDRTGERNSWRRITTEGRRRITPPEGEGETRLSTSGLRLSLKSPQSGAS